MELLIEWFEIIGTIAFASSGAMIAIREGMDVFGVNILGLATAVGGGIFRDVLLGITPPGVFSDWKYLIIAVVTSTLLFAMVYLNQTILSSRFLVRYEGVMLFLDAVGLGIFTVVGINTAIRVSHGDNVLLLIFVGILTGTGGGVLRDIMAGRKPYILVKHVYACASLAGAVVYLILLEGIENELISMVLSALLVVVIRLLAAHYRWNLPRIHLEGKQ